MQRPRRCERRGAAAVEFALTAPLVFVLFFAQIEFSRFNMIRHSIDSAAYEGARRGIVPGATVADVKAEALTILNAAGAAKPDIVVTPKTITNSTRDVTVTIRIKINDNGWVVPRYFAGDEITASCTLAREKLDGT